MVVRRLVVTAAAASRLGVRRRAWAALPPPFPVGTVRTNVTLAGDADQRQFRALAATFAAIEQSRSSREACVSLLAQSLRGLLPASPTDGSADLAAALLLTASQLAAPHEGVELRFGTKSFAPVLQRLFVDGASIQWDELLPSLPDYGAAVPLLWDRRVTTASDATTPPLTVAQVHAALVDMAAEQGKGSTQRKQDRAVALLLQCQTVDEMVYLVRLLAHQKLRISMGEKSILAALALACLPPSAPLDAASPSPPDANAVKAWTDAVVTAYSQCPDYGALAALLCELTAMESDVPARTERLLEAAAPRVGVPVLTMAAYPIGSVREAVTRLRKSGAKHATCEYKYDGARVQLHLSRSGLSPVRRVFSRNMEDQTDKYGSLLDVIERQLRDGGSDDSITELVMEGEVVAIDRASHALLPFQVLQTKTTTEFCLFAFDLLSLNGKSLIQRPLAERRQRLKAALSPQAGHFEFVDHIDVDLIPWDRETDDNDEVTRDVEHRIRAFLEASVAFGCEGLMVKTLVESAEYRAGARSFSWMKLKHDYLSDETEEASSSSSSSSRTSKNKTTSKTTANSGTFLPDTLDLVPIAAFYGKGRRAGVFGSFLLASVDAATGNYETIGKVGSGFSDAQLLQLSDEFRRDGAILKETNGRDTELPTGYVAATTAAQRPDVWLAPLQVWEIKATQLTLSPSYTAGSTQLSTANENNGDDDDTTTTQTRRKNKGLALRFPRFVRVRPEKSPDQATDSAQIAVLFQQQSESLSPSSPPSRPASDSEES